jgi:hypothetical protein
MEGYGWRLTARGCVFAMGTAVKHFPLNLAPSSGSQPFPRHYAKCNICRCYGPDLVLKIHKISLCVDRDDFRVWWSEVEGHHFQPILTPTPVFGQRVKSPPKIIKIGIAG